MDDPKPTRPVETAVEAALAARPLLASTDLRARMLDAIAAALDAEQAAILQTCAAEAGLWETELAPEFARMTGTVRLFADRIREGSWVRAAIDRRSGSPGGPASTIGPNHDLRSILMPLDGVVVVFGASNFPLAYGVCGGDTSSALAAGCPVVVKEHPAHPKTGRLIAQVARRAITSCGGPADVLGYSEIDDRTDILRAEALIRAAGVVAVGFTGSTAVGRQIQTLAAERDAPIPVFAEMGSSNIVILGRSVIQEETQAIAAEIIAGLTARAGQQCTNTGLVIIDRPDDADVHDVPDAFVKRLETGLLAAKPRRMLSERVQSHYEDRLADIDSGGPRECRIVRAAAEPGAPALVLASRSELDDPRYRDEIFGPACVVIAMDLDNPERLERLLFGLNRDQRWGQLVSSIYLGASPRPAELQAITTMQRVAGRVVINGVPTGVRVCDAMVHGGPHPATNDPHTTAVGPRAIERWCRPVCFQNFPDHLLPEELRDANPRRILRQVDGVFTRDPIPTP